ncbi:MAG: hypothetical protein EZS28_055694, partial [Streblomastix strix]
MNLRKTTLVLIFQTVQQRMMLHNRYFSQYISRDKKRINRRISQNQYQKPELLTEYIENKLDSGQKLFLFKDDIQKAGARTDGDTDNESESSESDQKQETSKVKRQDNQNTQRSEIFKTDSQIMKERHPRSLLSIIKKDQDNDNDDIQSSTRHS